jgi:hypothetical protein
MSKVALEAANAAARRERTAGYGCTRNGLVEMPETLSDFHLRFAPRLRGAAKWWAVQGSNL